MGNIYENLRMTFGDYADDLADEGVWESEIYAPLIFLSINEVEGGISYACDIHPSDDSEDVAALNKALLAKGYSTDGYGWEEYLSGRFEDNEKLSGVEYDSESETCGLFVMDEDSYNQLLAAVSKAIRALLK